MTPFEIFELRTHCLSREGVHSATRVMSSMRLRLQEGDESAEGMEEDGAGLVGEDEDEEEVEGRACEGTSPMSREGAGGEIEEPFLSFSISQLPQLPQKHALAIKK